MHGEATTQQDSAPLRSAFGPLAPRVAKLIRKQPLLAGRLLCAPLRAIHAVAAYIHLTAPADDNEAAALLAETAPRDLLRTAMPGVDARLYRALDRCGSSILSRTCYERLAAIAAGSLIEVLLATDRGIDAPYIRYVAKLADADGVVRHIPPRLLADQSATDAVLATFALLRAYNMNVDGALTGLPKAAGWEAVYRRLTNLLGALEAPPLAYPLPLGLRQITTMAGLRETGLALGLCVQAATHGGSEHWLRLVSGSSVYLVVDETRILMELRSVAPGLWMFGEAKQSHNRMAPPGTLRALAASLVTSGWKLVDTDPVAALVTLACRSNDDFGNWDRTLGQVLRELDHEWA